MYAGLTLVALISTYFILSRKTVHDAIAFAKAARGEGKPVVLDEAGRVGADLPCIGCGYNLRTLRPDACCPECGKAVRESMTPRETEKPQTKEPFDFIRWLRNHPLADAKFTFFIFCLIPVQTLFAHNWLTLPMYVERAFRGSLIGDYFEFAVNLNPILIFVFVPIVTALTQRANVYRMMIIGTAVMAAPTLLLAIGPSPWTLFGYLVIMTIGEAMWQPRFLQYAAEIAPEGRTGAYMVPLYSGWFLKTYCPPTGEHNTRVMWLIYGCIALTSCVLLILAKGWIGKDFKAKAA